MYGLCKSSIPFWVYVIEKNAVDLLDLILEGGDERTTLIPRVLLGPVDLSCIWNECREVYYAVLIRLRFSSMCNEHVVGNYRVVLEEKQFSYHSFDALLECRQHEFIAGIDLDATGENAPSALIDRLFRSGKVDFTPALAKLLVERGVYACLVKSLIRKGSNAFSVEYLFDAYQAKGKKYYDSEFCFAAPFRLIERLVLDPEFSIADAQETVALAKGYVLYGERFSCEAHALHILIFWEAPEPVIAHFFDQVPLKITLPFELLKIFLLSKKYSTQFLAKCVLRLAGRPWSWWKLITERRLDLAKCLQAQQEASGIVAV